MEAASLTTSPGPNGALSRRPSLVRFQSDERLVALMREGHERAFEFLFRRYQARLLAFCRRLLGSPQDAEDVLQEVFAAAHAAILADSRPINARPWLYRIARNQCVNHLRKPSAVGVDSMDVHPYEHGVSTFEQVENREELRAIVADVHQLPKKQRTALVLREVDDLSYGDIAQTMGTTLPSVKSLLVRARTSLAQSSHGRGALAPLGLLALLRRLLPTKLKLGGSSGAGGTAGGVAGTAGSVAAGGSGLTFSGALGAASSGIGGALGAKAAVGVATAAIVTAGAVGVAKMDLDGHGRTAGAGGSATTPQAASSTGSSAASRTAAGQLTAGTAAGSTARAHSGHWQGAKAGKSSPGHLPDLGRSVTRTTGHATRAAAAGASAAAAAVASTTHAASNAAADVGASVKPPKSIVAPAPRLGQGTGLSDVQLPGLSDRHPLPPKLGPAETLIP